MASDCIQASSSATPLSTDGLGSTAEAPSSIASIKPDPRALELRRVSTISPAQLKPRLPALTKPDPRAAGSSGCFQSRPRPDPDPPSVEPEKSHSRRSKRSPTRKLRRCTPQCINAPGVHKGQRLGRRASPTSGRALPSRWPETRRKRSGSSRCARRARSAAPSGVRPRYWVNLACWARRWRMECSASRP